MADNQSSDNGSFTYEGKGLEACNYVSYDCLELDNDSTYWEHGSWIPTVLLHVDSQLTCVRVDPREELVIKLYLQKRRIFTQAMQISMQIKKIYIYIYNLSKHKQEFRISCAQCLPRKVKNKNSDFYQFLPAVRYNTKLTILNKFLGA